jgi:hypothetical protein
MTFVIPTRKQKQIPFGNDRKKDKEDLAFFAFLSVIPEGNLLS